MNVQKWQKPVGVSVLCGNTDYIHSPKAVIDILQGKTIENLSEKPEIRQNLQKYCPKGRKTLFFRSLLNYEGASSSALSQCTWYLASSLKKNGMEYLLSDAKLTPDGKDFFGREELAQLLSHDRDIVYAVIPLTEFYIEGAKRLCRFIRHYAPDCVIAMGGIMPTRHPYHVMAHFDDVGLIIRGDGDKALPAAINAISSGDIRSFETLKGVMYRNGGIFIAANPEYVNREKDLDSLFLDFSMLEKRDIFGGGYFYVSRGCRNACNFCVSYSRGNPRFISYKKALEWFGAYHDRACSIYDGKVPRSALNIGFYDDDFFADRQAGLDIINAAARSGLKVSFVQTAIRSFLKNGRIHQDFVNSLNPEYFSESCLDGDMHPNLFIGTENFCDDELEVLGKGYGICEVNAVSEALSRQGITQRHHLILSNVFTTERHIKSNIAAIYNLRKRFPNHFYLLQSITPALYSFFGTASYSRAEKAGLLDYARHDTLRIRNFPEFDYPVAIGDIPADRNAAKILPAAMEAIRRL